MSAGVLVILLLAGCGSVRRPPTIEKSVLAFVDSSQRDGGGEYRRPPGRVRSALSAAVLAAAAGQDQRAQSLAERHGYEVVEDGDFRLVQPVEVPDRRGWGLYVGRPRGLPVAVEVPHPRADLRTERLGAALADRVDARYLLVAGTHRDADDDGAADVAHERSSVFSSVHLAVARLGVPAVQLHGYARRTSPDADVVVSSGSAPLSPLVVGIADALQAAGFRTCRAWEEDCGPLAGTRNVQAAASADAETPFVHLEVSSTVREDRGRSERLVRVVAQAVTTAVLPVS